LRFADEDPETRVLSRAAGVAGMRVAK